MVSSWWREHRLQVGFGLLLLALTIEAVRDALLNEGDFSGYIHTGVLLLQGEDIYLNPELNTWPPFFALVCAPLAVSFDVSPVLTRLVWLVASAMVWLACASWLGRLQTGHRQTLLQAGLLLPLLFNLRLMLENMASIQINALLLGLSVAAVLLWQRGRVVLAGLCLGLAISMKVFPVFILALFGLRGQWRMLGWTLLWVVLAAAAPVLVFGFATTLEYYAVWGGKAFGQWPVLTYKNQALLATAVRLLTDTDASVASHKLGAGYYVNFVNLEPADLRRAYHLLVVTIGLAYLWLTRATWQQNRLGLERRSDRLQPEVLLDIALAFGACMLLSPIVWKSYGVFLLPLLVVLYPYLYPSSAAGSPEPTYAIRKWLRVAYHLGWGLTTFSSRLFLGSPLNDITEAYGVITWGTLILIGVGVWVRFDKRIAPTQLDS